MFIRLLIQHQAEQELIEDQENAFSDFCAGLAKAKIGEMCQSDSLNLIQVRVPMVACFMDSAQSWLFCPGLYQVLPIHTTEALWS